MPACAVASFTPDISGMSGTLVGASGETEEDMRASGNRAKGSALYHLSRLTVSWLGPKMRKPGWEMLPTRLTKASHFVGRGHFFAGGAILESLAVSGAAAGAPAAGALAAWFM